LILRSFERLNGLLIISVKIIQGFSETIRHAWSLNNATARASRPFRAESSLGRQFDATIDARMAANEAPFSQPQLNNHLPLTGPQPPSGTTPEEMADNV